MKKCVFYFITYFVVCFGGLGSLYRLVSLLMGEPAFPWVLFGWNHRLSIRCSTLVLWQSAML